MITEEQVQGAQQQLLGEVYLPTFIKACAARGLEIETEAQLGQALRIADGIRAAGGAEAASMDKRAGVMTAAADALEQYMGVTPVVETPAVSEGAEKAASVLVQTLQSAQPTPATA